MLKEKLTDPLNVTIHVLRSARRRVLEGERIDNSEKLFSLFEPHTELIIRGKVPQPVEFGHRVLVIKESRGFVCHYAILPRGAEDSEVLVEEMKPSQQRLNSTNPTCVVRSRLSLFAENQRELVKLVEQPCLLEPGHVQAERQEQEATVELSARHGGVTRGSSRQLASCSLAMVWIGVEIKNYGPPCGYVGLGILVRKYSGLGKAVDGGGGEPTKCEAGQSQAQAAPAA